MDARVRSGMQTAGCKATFSGRNHLLPVLERLIRRARACPRLTVHAAFGQFCRAAFRAPATSDQAAAIRAPRAVRRSNHPIPEARVKEPAFRMLRDPFAMNFEFLRLKDPVRVERAAHPLASRLSEAGVQPGATARREDEPEPRVALRVPLHHRRRAVGPAVRQEQAGPGGSAPPGCRALAADAARRRRHQDQTEYFGGRAVTLDGPPSRKPPASASRRAPAPRAEARARQIFAEVGVETNPSHRFGNLDVVPGPPGSPRRQQPPAGRTYSRDDRAATRHAPPRCKPNPS